MQIYLKTFLTLILVSISSSGAMAATEYQRLFSKGKWSVDLNYPTSGEYLWCSADTYSSSQAFSLNAWSDQTFSISVFDDNWNLAPRDVVFQVQVDNRTNWTMNGSASESSVYIFPDDLAKTATFLEEVMQGNVVRVRNQNGLTVAQFSLSGSYASTLKLFECMKMIGWGNSRSDPFGNSGDPFR